ncbi:MAG TPA: GNAT family protein [Anaerolineales bacterium]|jgi:RimJ/RimL family protein N-acetyltransferase
MLDNHLLTGNLVRLAAIDPEKTAATWAKWGLNSEYLRLSDLGPATIHSQKAIKEWIEKHLDDWLACEFEIRTIEGDRAIGSTGLGGDMKVHGDAFVGIGIGEPEFWGRGYGTEAMQLILRFAFMELNLQRVSLNVFDYNPRAVHSYEKAGFKHEGRQRGALLREGKRWDLIFMGILREEWLAQNPAEALTAQPESTLGEN